MRIYRHFHFLSLDIVLGALASSCFAARLFNANPGWAWWLALAGTVWVLYTGDHLLDAWKHRKKSNRELHQFIFRNRKNLLWFMGVVSAAVLFLVFNFMERSFLIYALLLAGVVLLFYAMRHVFRKNRLLFIPGEIFILLIYLAGTWLGPLVARSGELQTPHALIGSMVAGVLLMNLGIISLYDIKRDTRLGITSLAHSLGKQTTRNVLFYTAIMVYLLAILQFLVFGVDQTMQFAFILAGMTTILLLVLLLPAYFRKNETYRLASDAVLYMGFLSLLINL